MMRAEAQLTTPNDAPVSITLRGTLGEFDALATAIRNSEIQHYQVMELLSAISQAAITLRGKVITEEVVRLPDAKGS